MGSVEQETQVQLEVANRAFDVRQRQPTHQVKDTCLLLVVHQLTSCLLDCRLFSLGASSVRSARVYVRARERVAAPGCRHYSWERSLSVASLAFAGVISTLACRYRGSGPGVLRRWTL
jgi:hypothetical protein